ncbi:FAD-dependent oxidoreductase [Ferrimicrobium sp.]|uniref:NAD(P)/FAD-dependent oxidoreductase n=1 Tax=Ferrimicrobium sp. TaxID=2926050 RepID=UPI00261A8878|nr:FAD-dependent oxidoreductase [Ferrimicrobium sp.]
MRRLVVVGGALAGHRAAVQARRLDPELDITVLAAEDELPYQRPPLSKGYLLGTVSAQRVRLRGGGEGYRLLPHTPALGLDLGKSLVFTADQVHPFDLLVVATGAEPRQLEGFPPDQSVRYLRTLTDATRLKEALNSIGHLTVIGGGFIGAEVAISARSQGVQVTIVEQSPHLFSRVVGRGVSRIVEDNLRKLGVQLLLNSTTHLELAGKQPIVSDGTQTWTTDLVVVGVGVNPCTAWLNGTLPLAEDQGIHVDAMGLVTGFEQIGAAGDVASWDHPLYGRSIRFEHFEVATNQALHTAQALVANRRVAYDELPFGWSDQGDLLLQVIGVPDPTLIEEEEEVEDGKIFLYRRDDHLEGAVLVNAPEELTKLRDKIMASLRNR